MINFKVEGIDTWYAHRSQKKLQFRGVISKNRCAQTKLVIRITHYLPYFHTIINNRLSILKNIRVITGYCYRQHYQNHYQLVRQITHYDKSSGE